MTEPSTKPDWRKGDVILLTVPGCHRWVELATEDPHWGEARGAGEWLYGFAKASDFRRATAADIATYMVRVEGDIARAAAELHHLAEMLQTLAR